MSKGTRKMLKVIKDNLLVGTAIAAFLIITMQLNDSTPLGNAREIITTAICFTWLMVFGYAQITK